MQTATALKERSRRASYLGAFRVSGLGFRVFRISGLGFRGLGFGLKSDFNTAPQGLSTEA